MMKQQRDYYEEEYWQKGSTKWSPHNQHPSSTPTQIINKLVYSGMYILDYGCGDCSKYGNLITSLGATYTGVDVSLKVLQECRKSSYSVTLFNGEIYSLPFVSSRFDLVLCLEVLEHLFRPDLALHNILRVLKPNGFLIISTPNIAWIGNRLLMALGFFNPGGSPETSFRAPWRDAHIRFLQNKVYLD